MKYFLLILYISIFCSCIYKAGNRQPDINQRYDVSISPFYIKEYMKRLDLFYAKSMLVTSEIVNYPENFIPITDSLLGYKYVIEFHNLDSINYIQNHYLNLASIYDFKKRKWVKEVDSLKNSELAKFQIFFKDSVLVKVVQRYKNTIPDSLLFVGKPIDTEIKPLE